MAAVNPSEEAREDGYAEEVEVIRLRELQKGLWRICGETRRLGSERSKVVHAQDLAHNF